MFLISGCFQDESNSNSEVCTHSMQEGKATELYKWQLSSATLGMLSDHAFQTGQDIFKVLFGRFIFSKFQMYQRLQSTYICD